MAKIEKPWDLLSKDQKAKALEEVLRFFETERGETMGVIAAEEILDFFLETIASKAFNQGIDKAQKTLSQSLQDIVVDLEMLKK